MDDRRRRRLAKESDETVSNNAASEKITKPESPCSKAEQISARKRLRRHFPLRKLISQRKWKVVTAACLAIVSSVLVVLSGFYSEWVSLNLGVGFSTFANPLSGKLAMAATGCWLMLSGQLALLTWWVRSNSLSDFEGKYRIWPYASLAMFLASFGIMTDAHQAFSATFQLLFHTSFWKQEVISWLAPTLAISFSLLAGLHREMRDCRSSHLLLLFSACSASVAAFLSLELVLPYNMQYPALVQASLILISAASLFSSMLLHTRYVIHESAEAPRKRTSLFKRIAHLLPKRKKTKPPTEAKTSTRKKRASKKKQATEKATTPKKKPTRKRAIPEIKLTPQNQSTPQEEIQEEVEVIETPEPQPEPVIEQPEAITFEPVDSNSLKGLSKKERRKIRKQAREQQREEQHDGRRSA
ncbi:hypothetical protein MNBD_PLANCTO02-1967 [hydrothermal vent metagenome]|uniref:Uncharacterized protein n=1 Tax=hydrothermal vent metagenome TaxID=652676 RepID=A0A3B1E7X6_9ZZZZ